MSPLGAGAHKPILVFVVGPGAPLTASVAHQPKAGTEVSRVEPVPPRAPREIPVLSPASTAGHVWIERPTLLGWHIDWRPGVRRVDRRRPFVHVAGEVQHPERTRPAWKAAHRGRAADPRRH